MTAPRHLPAFDEPYARAAFAALQALLQAAAVRWWEQIGRHKPDSLFGQPQVGDAEAEAALRLPFLGRDAEWPWSPAAVSYLHEAETLAEAARARRAQAPASPLARIETTYGLDEAGRDVLLLALVPELGTRHRRLLGYLMDDLAETRPTIAFAFEVLGPRHPETLRAALAPTAALRRGALVRPVPSAAGGAEGIAGQQCLAVAPELLAWLAEAAPTVGDGEDLVAHGGNGEAASVPPLPAAVGEGVAALARGRCRCLVLAGEGVDDPALADALAAASGALVAAVEPAALRDARRRRAAALRCRLGGAVPLLDLTELPIDVLDRYALAAMAPALVILRRARPELDPLLPAPALTVALPPPGYGARVVLWTRLLMAADGADAAAVAQAATSLADRFRLSPGAIGRAHARAQLAADAAETQLAFDELAAACRAEATPLLGGLAKRIAPDGATSLEDLVVPAGTRARIRDLIDRLDARRRLASLAPGDAGLLLNHATVALFAGAAGTGKTLAAVLIARALGADLFKADLSALVSKWVGETEKHLDRLFREAELANALLFFDEADALFGKRGEIKEARDRWANLEVNYLLQRIEDFDGGVILATNLAANIDEAFLRRIETVVDFPMPDATARARILETLMPRSFARPPSAELRELSEHLALAGGNLKNVVVHASFKALAAANGGDAPRIARRDLLEGAAREYEKLGRPVTAQAFGAELYQELCRDVRVR